VELKKSGKEPRGGRASSERGKHEILWHRQTPPGQVLRDNSCSGPVHEFPQPRSRAMRSTRWV